MNETKVWEFRKLNSRDIFPMMKIINKIGLNEFTACLESDSVKAIISGVQNDGNASIIGLSVILEIANVVAGNLPKCEQDIFDMLANTSNMPKKQIMELGMAEFFEMVVDFVKKEEFRDFVKVASRLLKSEN